MNDEFYTFSTTNSKPAFDASLGLTLIKNGSISLFNAVASYSVDKFSSSIDLIYVEATAGAEAQVFTKTKASGGALHLFYDFKPFKILSLKEK